MKTNENTKDQVYIDVNSKCNLNCWWCCNADHMIPDIATERFDEICASLPNNVEVRILGGEPTLHPEIGKLVDIAKQYRHMVTIITNGVKFADIEFCKEMKVHGPMIISMSMDSETSEETKIKALKNLQESGFKRIVITATITKNNTYMIKYMRGLTDRFSHIRYAHYRTMVNVENPLSFKELKEMVIKENPEWNNPNIIIRDGKEYKGQKCCGLCELRWITPKLQVLILDTSKICECHLRGYVNNENSNIAEFFPEIRRRNGM